MSLHVFQGECDWVVAADLEDAWEVWTTFTGERREDYPAGEFSQLPDDESMAIWDGDDGLDGTETCECAKRGAVYLAAMEAYNKAATDYVGFMSKIGARLSDLPPIPQPKDRPGPNGHYAECTIGHPRKTCGEWAVQNGRGFLCSTEF